MRTDQADWYMREDPRAHSSAMIFWQDNHLTLSHPSDFSAQEAFDTASADGTLDETAKSVLFFFPGPDPAQTVLPPLARIPRVVAWVMMVVRD